MHRPEAGARVCEEERGKRMKLTFPAPSETPSKSLPWGPPSPGWHRDPLYSYPLLPQGQGSRCRSPFLFPGLPAPSPTRPLRRCSAPLTLARTFS